MRLALALLCVLLPGTAMAASGNAGTLSGTAAATAVRPLTLVHWTGTQLNFGRFTSGSPGTVTVNGSTGAATASGGAVFVTGSTTAMDYFIANGDPNRLIAITTGSGTVTSGTRSMSFTTSPMLTAGYLPAGGSGYFTVGGTLSVGLNQGAGSYTGSYAVTVAYN